MTETRLRSLRIHANYGKPGYLMTAEFEGLHKVELQMKDGLADEIVKLCADRIVDTIHNCARDVTRTTLLRGPEVARKELEHDDAGT